MPLSVVSPLQIHRHEFHWEGLLTVQKNENEIIIIHHASKELEHMAEGINVRLMEISDSLNNGDVGTTVTVNNGEK